MHRLIVSVKKSNYTSSGMSTLYQFQFCVNHACADKTGLVRKVWKTSKMAFTQRRHRIYTSKDCSKKCWPQFTIQNWHKTHVCFFHIPLASLSSHLQWKPHSGGRQRSGSLCATIEWGYQDLYYSIENAANQNAGKWLFTRRFNTQKPIVRFEYVELFGLTSVFPVAWYKICKNIKSYRYATLSSWRWKANKRNVWYSLLDQKRRRNRRRRRKSKLHQVERSS